MKISVDSPESQAVLLGLEEKKERERMRALKGTVATEYDQLLHELASRNDYGVPQHREKRLRATVRLEFEVWSHDLTDNGSPARKVIMFEEATVFLAMAKGSKVLTVMSEHMYRVILTWEKPAKKTERAPWRYVEKYPAGSSGQGAGQRGKVGATSGRQP